VLSHASARETGALETAANSNLQQAA
jgi:hypothetical protein